MGLEDIMASIGKGVLPTADDKKNKWQELLDKAMKEAESLKEPTQSFPEVQNVVEQEDQLSTEKPKKTAFDVNEGESSSQALDNWDTGKELETALKLDPETGKLDIAPKQASESRSPRDYIQTIIDNNPYLAPVYKDTEFQQGTENWKRKNREGAEEFAKNKNAESATELINRALAMRGEYSAPQKNTSIEEKIQDLLANKQIYDLPGAHENIPKETRDKAVADIDNELASLYAANIGNNAAYVGDLASDKAKWDQDTNELIQGLIDEGSNFYGYDKSDFTKALMNAGILPEKGADAISEDAGKAAQETAPTSSVKRKSQSDEYDEWFDTDEGQAWRERWSNAEGIDPNLLNNKDYSYSYLRTLNNRDIWGDLYGYGDLIGPNNGGWKNRARNSGIDVDAEDALDRLMEYMFGEGALTTGDLLANNWNKYGGYGSQDALIKFLHDIYGLGLVSDKLDNLGQQYGYDFTEAFDAGDYQSLYMLARLQDELENGSLGLNYSEIESLANEILGNSGEQFEFGLTDKDSAYQKQDRNNPKKFTPSMLTDNSADLFHPYVYDENGQVLLDQDFIDSWYEVLQKAAEKEGAGEVGLKKRGA